jgi:hypothetical protein
MTLNGRHSGTGRRKELALAAAADYAYVHQELKRKGVTLQLLWGRLAIRRR